MKRKAIQDLKTKPIEALEEEMRVKEHELREIKLAHALGKIKNQREMQDVKKLIARLHTFIHMKKIEQKSI